MTSGLGLFRDRIDAGQRLADALRPYHGSDAVVLGIPRGGVPVAAEVARLLGLPLDIVVARKLGAPGQPELAIGAVTANGGLYLNHDLIRDLGVDQAYLDSAVERKRAEARDRESRFRGGRPGPALAGRIAIVVDDGLATGATIRAAVQSVRHAGPAKLVVAVPVGAIESCASLRSEVDELVCLWTPDDFMAVGQFYDDFSPTEDDEVERILRAASTHTPDTDTAREITFQNRRGRRLAGTLLLPRAVERPPVVVFAHGFNSSRRSSRNLMIAERLVASGLAAFLIDFTGHGDSEGEIREATVKQMADDLRSAIDHISAEAAVDAGRIGLSGSSSGGIVSVIEAARDERVRVLVLRSVPAGDLFEPAAHIRATTLVIAGEADIPIVEEDRALAEVISGPHRFEVVAHAGHLFEGPGEMERVSDLSVGWFVSHLRADTRSTT